MSQPSQKTYAYDDFDCLGSDGDVAYTYDAAGNVTRIERDGRPTLGLVWNSQYQLVSVSTNGVFAERYTYDAPRRRELRKVACGVMYLHLPKRGSL